MPNMHAVGDGGVCIAITTYGAMSASVVHALCSTQHALERAGIAYTILLLSGNCHVDDARNSIAAKFLQSQCTDLVCIDADIAWQADDFLNLIAYDRDFVAGVYPFKQLTEAYPVRLLPTAFQNAEADGLLEVEAVPGGFVRMRRDVVQKLWDAATQAFRENPGDKFLTRVIWARDQDSTTHRSGDYAMCARWRALGGRIYIDPMFRFDHFGEHGFRGCYGAYLRKINKQPLDGILRILMGTATFATLKGLREDWGNSWAAKDEVLFAAMNMAREATGDILEYGSGLTTLVMAAANPRVTVNAIEHDAAQYNRTNDEAVRHGLKNVSIWLCPLGADGFYDMTQVFTGDIALTLVDGPPRPAGSRSSALSRLNGSAVLFDDVDDMREQLAEWAASQGRQIGFVDNFAAITAKHQE